MKVDGKMHFCKANFFTDEKWWVCLLWDEDACNWRVGGAGSTWQKSYENYLKYIR